MALPGLKFPDLLRGVINEFQGYLADPENACLVVGDEKNLGEIFSLVADLEGDFNYHLKYHPQTVIFCSWYFNKYLNQLTEITRQASTCYNLLFTAKRSNGYGEWDAKRMAETDKSWLELVRKQDRMQRLVNILKSLVDACKDRRPVLEQLSNNYRAELKDEQSVI